ncbi:hypothetical protein KI387_021406, partial [Taxus chinensis]
MQTLEVSTSTQQQSASGDRTSSSGDQHEAIDTYVNESDDDIPRVPEMGFMPGQAVNSAAVKTENYQQGTSGGGGQRKRGRTPADKEHKRLKRLLRNRVSAQQARERKKAYLGELETKAKELEDKNSELEERVSTLQNENFMLRQ